MDGAGARFYRYDKTYKFILPYVRRCTTDVMFDEQVREIKADLEMIGVRHHNPPTFTTYIYALSEYGNGLIRYGKCTL